MQIVEPLGPGLTRVWELHEVLFAERTAYQDVLIGRTSQGLSLFCDNERQSTEATQLVYHEALMVPAVLLAEQVRRVLIIGSSEGVACELALAAGAEAVDHVDIDEKAVQACAEHLPYGYTPADLGRAERGEGPVRMHYRDGWEFVATARRHGAGYDVIVIDLPDENAKPAAQHNRLYGKDFLMSCRALLTDGGVLASQAGCPAIWRNRTLLASWQRFHEVFTTVSYFGSDEHEWAFLTGRAEHVDDPAERMVQRFDERELRASTIDVSALRGGTIPPLSLRRLGIAAQADTRVSKRAAALRP